MMELDENDVQNQGEGTLSYMSWYEHATKGISNHWKTFIIYSIGIFGVFWGIIEAGSFFYPKQGLNNSVVLNSTIGISLFSAIVRCFYDYHHNVPVGLENESATIQNIIRLKQPFWEYALAYELLNSRIDEIDKKFDDVINNRVHVKVTNTMDVFGYAMWVETRPENLTRLVSTAKQLLAFDLFNAISTKNGEEIDYRKLIKVVDLITDLYKNAYDYEIELHEIKIPEGFELIHEIQLEWIPVIRDGFHQIRAILKSVAERDNGDYSPIEATVTFEAPPRIEEFCEELKRLQTMLEY